MQLCGVWPLQELLRDCLSYDSCIHRAEWNFIGLNWHDSGFMFQVVRLVSPSIHLSAAVESPRAWCYLMPSYTTQVVRKSFCTMPERGVGHVRTCLRCVAMLQMGRFPHTELTLTTGLSVLNTNVLGSFSFVRHVPGFNTLLSYPVAVWKCTANLFYVYFNIHVQWIRTFSNYISQPETTRRRNQHESNEFTWLVGLVTLRCHMWMLCFIDSTYLNLPFALIHIDSNHADPIWSGSFAFAGASLELSLLRWFSVCQNSALFWRLGRNGK